MDDLIVKKQARNRSTKSVIQMSKGVETFSLLSSIVCISHCYQHNDHHDHHHDDQHHDDQHHDEELCDRDDNAEFIGGSPLSCCGS